MSDTSDRISENDRIKIYENAKYHSDQQEINDVVNNYIQELDNLESQLNSQKVYIHKRKGEIVKEFTEFLKSKGFIADTIASIITQKFKGKISKSHIQELLSSEYKREYNKDIEQNTIQLVRSGLIDEKNRIEESSIDKKKKQPVIAVTNSGSHEIDEIYGGKSLEQMRKEANREIEEDKEGTLQNPANMLRETSNPAKESLVNNTSLSTPTTTRLLSDTPSEVRDMQARISELEEALRIQKEEAETKGKRYFELKRKYLQNSPENLRRENAELKVMLNNLKTLNEESTINNNESVKEELDYKEIELFKLDSTKVTWLLKTSKESERTVFLVINPKSMEIVDVKTDKEMHRIQRRREHEKELVEEAKAVTAKQEVRS
jgi:hypothetical protein